MGRSLGMEKNKIYVSDIDGTLVQEKKNPKKQLIKEIKNIVENDTMFLFATARSLDSVKERFERIKMKIISRNRSVNYR